MVYYQLKMVKINMSDLCELSNNKIIKLFAAESSDVVYEHEIFKRLENNEFSDADIVKICFILIEKRELENLK